MNPYPPISRHHLISYGVVRRSHGHRGDVVLEVHSEELFQHDPEFLFLEKDSLFVPFKVEEMRGSRKQLIVSFEQMLTEEQANYYRGAEVYIHDRELTPEELEEMHTTSYSLHGYIVQHISGKSVGTIKEIDDSTPNILLKVEAENGAELLLPFVEEWVVELDDVGRKIVLDCPLELTDPL